jgi:hypothetical protein
MADQLTKLRPDRDLQCYFQQPSATAALSQTSEAGFTVSGCWRQQFDWAVVEWSRDNVFEHPALRNLPDGDLTSLRLTYEEARTNCIPMDSTVYDGIGWSYLRVWEQSGSSEVLHWVPLRPYATPVSGSYVAATATLQLEGTPTPGDQIELAWLDQHCSYVLGPGDTLAGALAGLAAFINGDSQNVVRASVDDTEITLTYTGAPGANGNRVGVYGTVHGAGTERWTPGWAMFTGGSSPERWRIDLDFSNLADRDNNRVDTSNVRKIRWTWMADLQFSPYQRSEFQVVVSNWQVTGTGLSYKIAGPGSRRIEDDSAEVAYSGNWTEERGNYSGGSIHHSTHRGSQVRCAYEAPVGHTLYLGTRYVDKGGTITVQVDAAPAQAINVNRDLEDVLVRLRLGDFAAGPSHTVTITHSGDDGAHVYFDFLEIAVPSTTLPSFTASPIMTLATDWDTEHSIAIAPERTAWIINTLGFRGRANHYVGAMWFYELLNSGNQYASGTIQFSGNPEFGDSGVTAITIGGTVIQHRNLIGDTAETIAKCFELLITAGSSSVWAHAEGTTLRITARALGLEGNLISLSADTHSQQFTATVSGPTFTGGLDGTWLTDLGATPRLNRAVRDWSRSYYRALHSYGIDVAAAFSMELRHGDDSLSAGIAQRYLAGPCWLNTPALQTNFGPAATDFWRQVHLDMATVMSEAGVSPYLQFGEVQWWYFGDGESMPFYDAYTTQAFAAAYGRPMRTIPSQNADPAQFPEECAFLPTMIGQFTQAVMSYVRQTYPATRFEVLYPPDVNDTALNGIINFPKDHWTSGNLDCLKTENFTFTGNRNLNKARDSINLPSTLGFPPSKSSHLVGIGDYTTPWNKERRLAAGAAMESVVLFALDQICLVGCSLPLDPGPRRARFQGA